MKIIDIMTVFGIAVFFYVTASSEAAASSHLQNILKQNGDRFLLTAVS